MDGRRRHDLADEVERLVVPDARHGPASESPGRQPSVTCGGVAPQRPGASRRQEPGEPRGGRSRRRVVVQSCTVLRLAIIARRRPLRSASPERSARRRMTPAGSARSTGCRGYASARVRSRGHGRDGRGAVSPHVSRAIVDPGSSARSSAVAAIGLAVGVSAVPRPARRRAGALPAPRFVEEALAAGVEHAYDGELRRSSSAAGSPPSTATATGGRTSTSPAAAAPAALFRNESPSRAARCASSAGRRPVDRPDRRDRRLPARHRRRRHDRPRRPARRRERAPARPRRLPVRAGQRGAGRSTAATPGRRRSARPGRRDATCRRWRSATTSTDADRRTDRPCCATTQLVRPTASGDGYGAADRARRRAGARSRCCSATGTAPGRRDLRV